VQKRNHAMTITEIVKIFDKEPIEERDREPFTLSDILELAQGGIHLYCTTAKNGLDYRQNFLIKEIAASTTITEDFLKGLKKKGFYLNPKDLSIQRDI